MRVIVEIMNLAEEFALLAYDDDGAAELDGTARSTTASAAALLLELALAERVDIVDKTGSS